MKQIYRIGVVCFLASVVLICAGSAGYAGGHIYGSGFRMGTFSFPWGNVDLSEERVFDMEGIRNVDVVCDSMNVILDGNEADTCVVKVYQRKNRKDAAVQMETAGDTLSIKKDGSYSTISVFGFGFGGSAERVEILLPKGYHGLVNVETGSGNIGAEADFRLQGLEAVSGSGNIRFRSVEAEKIMISAGSGNISLESAQGERNVSTGSGNIRILGGSGDTVVSSGSGGIDVDGLKGSLDSSAGSGNIRVRVDELSGDISIQTSSGNINLEVPGESSFTYKASAVSGNIRTDFDDVLGWNGRRNEAEGSYGSGGGIRVYTKASSGNTRVILK